MDDRAKTFNGSDQNECEDKALGDRNGAGHQFLFRHVIPAAGVVPLT